jgi:hypothetical protein
LQFDAGSQLVLPVSRFAEDGFTISAWARRTGPGSERQILFSQGKPEPLRGLHVGFLPPDRHFSLAFYTADLDIGRDHSRKGHWQHWAVTYDAATRMRAIYCDGRMVACDFPKDKYRGSGPLFVGTTAWGEPLPFQGDLDDLRVYRGAMLPSEVAALARNE